MTPMAEGWGEMSAGNRAMPSGSGLGGGEDRGRCTLPRPASEQAGATPERAAFDDFELFRCMRELPCHLRFNLSQVAFAIASGKVQTSAPAFHIKPALESSS